MSYCFELYRRLPNGDVEYMETVNGEVPPPIRMYMHGMEAKELPTKLDEIDLEYYLDTIGV